MPYRRSSERAVNRYPDSRLHELVYGAVDGDRLGALLLNPDLQMVVEILTHPRACPRTYAIPLMDEEPPITFPRAW